MFSRPFQTVSSRWLQGVGGFEIGGSPVGRCSTDVSVVPPNLRPSTSLPQLGIAELRQSRQAHVHPSTKTSTPSTRIKKQPPSRQLALLSSRPHHLPPPPSIPSPNLQTH